MVGHDVFVTTRGPHVLVDLHGAPMGGVPTLNDLRNLIDVVFPTFLFAQIAARYELRLKTDTDGLPPY